MEMSEDRTRGEVWQVWEWPIPTKGMTTSLLPFSVPPTAALALENVVLDFGMVRVRKGWFKLGSSLDSNVLKLFRAFDRDGNERLFCVTKSSLYEYTGGDWVSRFTGLSAVERTPISVAVHVNQKLYIATGYNDLLEYDLYTNTGAFRTDILYKKPRSVASVAGRLCLFNVEQGTPPVRYPNRIAYSGPFGSFQPGEAGVGTIDMADADDYIQTVDVLKDVAVIRRRKSVWLMSPTNETVVDVSGGIVISTPLVFRFERVLSGDVCESPRSFFSFGDSVYYVAGRNLWRLRAGLPEDVLPVGASLSPLLEAIADEDLALVTLGADPSTQTLYVSVPYPDTGVSDAPFLLRISLRTPKDPQLVKFTSRRCFAVGFGSYRVPGKTFNDLWTTPFSGVWGTPFRVLGGLLSSSMLFGVDNSVYAESTDMQDSFGAIPVRWVTGLSNFGSPWYKVVERVAVLVKRGSGALTMRVGFSFDGSTITWSVPQTKNLSDNAMVLFDWTLPEALMFAVELQSDVSGDMQIGSILAYWRPTSPGS